MASSNVRNDNVRSIDGIIVSVYFSLLFIGWLMITAVTFSEQQIESFSLVDSLLTRQSLWYGIAVSVFLGSLLLDYKFWDSTSWIWYVGGMVLLLLVVIFGREIKGATSWFVVGGFSFQPSEFAKLVTIINLAAYLGLASVKVQNNRKLLIALGIIALPPLLIMLQPDAGSALIFTSLLVVFYRAGLNPTIFIILFTLIGVVIGTLLVGVAHILPYILLIGMALLALQHRESTLILVGIGILFLITLAFVRFVDIKYLLIALGTLFTGFGIYTAITDRLQPVVTILVFVVSMLFISYAAHFGYHSVLKPHQQDRINVWLHPEKCDPQGSLYNVIQSKTAIGSGGFLGKGFLQGNMTKLNYVPEQSTDFIFSTLGEEQGFIGVLGVIILFFILLARITVIAERAKNDFIKYYAYGLAAMLFFQVFINIGMTMGVMPVIGIPLPFISKGGTALVIFSLMIGILVRMDLDRAKR